MATTTRTISEGRVVMRTIPEVAKDIKSILNNIERTQECNGETLVNIDELVNEILTINCYKDEPHTNADHIRNMSDEELAEFLSGINTGRDIGYDYFSAKGGIFIESNKNLIKKVQDWLQSERWE